MLRSFKDLESYKVSAMDGEVGRVLDFLFDDQKWTARYLITDTSGFWQTAHQVLISPISFRSVDWGNRLFHIGLTQAKVKSSPSVDLKKPVSRQYERDYSQYYGWPYYWGYGGLWGMGPYPHFLADDARRAEHNRSEEAHYDHHLRSAKEVGGYHVQGTDGAIGHIVDFIMDDETWTIRYLVIDTSNWWLGKKVLIPPEWAQKVSWYESMVYMDLTRDAIKNSPEWIPKVMEDREYEERLYAHYHRPLSGSRGDAKGKLSVQPPAGKHLYG